MRTLITIFFFLLLGQVYGQSKLTGTIYEETTQLPIPYASVALMSQDSTIIKGTIADADGKFIIDNIIPNQYILQGSFIGFEKYNLSIDIEGQNELYDIVLRESSFVMDEIVIKGQRPFMVQKVDRIVINVAENIPVSGLSVNDLLKFLPGLIVDNSGNISLYGRAVTVYIDGRPTRLPQEHVAQMLMGMQGDIVDRVELISNPSSRYEAGQSSAIVNIRLKKDASLGLKGGISGNWGYNDIDPIYGTRFNLNYRSEKLNIFGNYGYNNETNNQDIFQEKNFQNQIPITYSQNSEMRDKNPVNTFRVGVDWFINPKQTIGFLFNGSANKLDGSFISKIDITQTGISRVDSTVLSDIGLTQNSKSQTYNLNYSLLTNMEGEVLDINLDYGKIHDNNWQNVLSKYYDAGGNEQRLPSQFQFNGLRNIDLYSLKTDYTKPLGKSILEAGFKIGRTDTKNDIYYENLYNNQWVFDPAQSNTFNYTEQIGAIYTTFSREFGKISAMVGIRGEYTERIGKSITLDTTFTHKYLDLFPSMYLQYQISEEQSFNFSYSRKINRPNYSLLNPYRTYIDQYSYQSGNPDLKPSYINTLDLSWSFYNLYINAGYSIANDVFNQEWVQNNNDFTTNMIHKNLGKNQILSFNLYLPFSISDWYNSNISAGGMWNNIDNSYNAEKFTNKYFSSNFSFQNRFTIFPSFYAYFQFYWSKPGWEVINKIDDMWTIDVQLEKYFIDNKLRLALFCNDIFHSTIVKANANFHNIVQTTRIDAYQRNFFISLRYNFGSQKIRNARSREIGIEEEIGRSKGLK